jgi:hypothetical protein
MTMSETCNWSFDVGYFELGYWAEDCAPSFSGPDGWYIYERGEPVVGPFDSRQAAALELRTMLRDLARYEMEAAQ